MWFPHPWVTTARTEARPPETFSTGALAEQTLGPPETFFTGDDGAPSHIPNH